MVTDVVSLAEISLKIGKDPRGQGGQKGQIAKRIKLKGSSLQGK